MRWEVSAPAAASAGAMSTGWHSSAPPDWAAPSDNGEMGEDTEDGDMVTSLPGCYDMTRRQAEGRMAARAGPTTRRLSAPRAQEVRLSPNGLA